MKHSVNGEIVNSSQLGKAIGAMYHESIPGGMRYEFLGEESACRGWAELSKEAEKYGGQVERKGLEVEWTF